MNTKKIFIIVLIILSLGLVAVASYVAYELNKVSVDDESVIGDPLTGGSDIEKEPVLTCDGCGDCGCESFQLPTSGGCVNACSCGYQSSSCGYTPEPSPEPTPAPAPSPEPSPDPGSGSGNDTSTDSGAIDTSSSSSSSSSGATTSSETGASSSGTTSSSGGLLESTSSSSGSQALAQVNYSGVCGDGICNNSENILSCPSDCNTLPSTAIDSKIINLILGGVFISLGIVLFFKSKLFQNT